jgi:hypothetical protein
MLLLCLGPSSIISLGLDNASMLVGLFGRLLISTSNALMHFSTPFRALSSRSLLACGNQTDSTRKKQVLGNSTLVPRQDKSGCLWLFVFRQADFLCGKPNGITFP